METRRKNIGFGLGTLFSLIIVYFIYLFSSDKYVSTGETGWHILQFVAKWYLIISLGIAALVILLVLLTIIAWIFVYLKVRRNRRRSKPVDASYMIKE